MGAWGSSGGETRQWVGGTPGGCPDPLGSEWGRGGGVLAAARFQGPGVKSRGLIQGKRWGLTTVPRRKRGR